MSEIEKYYNGEIHVDFDEEIEELKADIEEYRDSTTWWSNRFNAVERDNRELRKEIERLQKENKKLKLCLGIVSPSRVLLEGKYWEKEDNEEIKRLKSIIKEVREYIEKRKDTQKWRKESLKEKSTNIDIVLEHYRDILEILDKENK